LIIIEELQRRHKRPVSVATESDDAESRVEASKTSDSLKRAIAAISAKLYEHADVP